MNTTAIIIAIKNRSLTKTQRKSLYAWAKYMTEKSYGTSELLIYFNIYCELNNHKADWFKNRFKVTMESRRELLRMSINYLRSNRPNIP